MPFRDNPPDASDYFARRDRDLMTRRDPDDDDDSDDFDIGGEGREFIDDSPDYEPDYFDQIED